MKVRGTIFGKGLRLLARALLAFGAAALLSPGAALCASAGGMAGDVLNSITRSPSAKQAQGQSSGGGGAQSGPTAPAQPVAPVVPGAAPLADPRSDRPLRELVRPAPQPRAGDRKGPRSAGRQLAPGRHELALTHDGAERRAVVVVPKTAQGKKGQAPQKLPVLIFLHGAGGSATQAMRQTGLAERAAAAGFLAVFPEGLGPNGAGGGASGDGQTWNAWMCCGYARDNRVDDVGFLTALIAKLRSDYGADPARIHLSGFSNGAMLASRFALERPGVAASLTSVAGYLPCDAQQPAGSLPVLVIHGAQDKVARFAPTEAKPATGRFCEDYPARAQVEFWVRGMRLSPKGRLQDSPKSPTRVEDYGPAKGKASGQANGQASGHGGGPNGRVRFVIVKNGGHAWPGGERERYRYCDLPTAGTDATGLVLDFIKRAGGQPQTAEPDGAQNRAQAKAKPGKAGATKRKPG
ncbi:MAG: dienelactone hydrolase family protein [Desulfovibrio sp.]|nr:dienelactone hydrolase family protein [Desulfovibrio sp.]